MPIPPDAPHPGSKPGTDRGTDQVPERHGQPDARHPSDALPRDPEERTGAAAEPDARQAALRRAAVAAAMAEAASHEADGRPDEALRIYLALAARDPQDTDAAYRAGTALMRRGDLDEAVSLLRRVVFNRPDHAAARANLGNALLLLGRDEAAREAFVAVLERAPDNRNALYGLATILIRLGRHGEAQRFSSRLLAALPDSAAALALDAEARGPEGGASAVAQYRQALRLDPDYVPALRGLAGLLHHQGRQAEAEDLALAALARQPGDAGLFGRVGAIRLAADDWTGALEAYAEARRHAPEDPAHPLGMSLACRKGGDLAGAIAHARDAWQLDGASRAAANALGAALAAAGAGIQARQVLMAGGRIEAVPVGVWRDLDAVLTHLETQAAERAREAAAARSRAELEAQARAAAMAALPASGIEAEAAVAAQAPARAPDDEAAAASGPTAGAGRSGRPRGDADEAETLPLFPDA